MLGSTLKLFLPHLNPLLILKGDDLKPGQLVDGDQTNLMHIWSPFSQLSGHSFIIWLSQV